MNSNEYIKGTIPTVWDTDGDGVRDGDDPEPLNPDIPPNANGVINYPYLCGQTGLIYVVAVTSSNSWATNHSACYVTPGEYQTPNLLLTNYWIKAWRDSIANGSPDPTEAWGIYSAVSTPITNQMFSLDITLVDPDTDADGLPDWWENQYFGSPTGCVASADSDGNGFLNIYKYKYGINPTNPAATPPGTRFVSTNGSNVFPYTNWATAATSIKAALAAATNSYEIVMVADGTYTGYTNGYVSFPSYPVMLTSTGNPENCIIDGCGTNSGFDFQNGQELDSVLNGFTIRNMRPYDNYPVYCSASPTIENCIMTSNSQCGAMLDIGAGDHPVIRNCVINDNESGIGGGIFSKARLLTR